MPRAGHVRKSFEIYTQDRLLLNYRGAVGVKTGWTTKARGTFVGAATRGGRTLVATVMHTGPKAWMESAALLDWGFAHADAVTPVGTLNQPGAAVVDAAAPVAKKRSLAGAPSAAAPGSEPTAPWYLWPVIMLALLVGALRARV